MESWSLRGSPRRLPLSVLTGFLGSDKTTVLNYLIQQPALSRQDRLIGGHSTGTGVQTPQMSIGFRCVKRRRVQDDLVSPGQLFAATLRTDQRVGIAARQDRGNAVQAQMFGHQRVVQQRLHHRCRIGIRQRLDQNLSTPASACQPC